MKWGERKNSPSRRDKTKAHSTIRRSEKKEYKRKGAGFKWENVTHDSIPRSPFSQSSPYPLPGLPLQFTETNSPAKAVKPSVTRSTQWKLPNNRLWHEYRAFQTGFSHTMPMSNTPSVSTRAVVRHKLPHYPMWSVNYYGWNLAPLRVYELRETFFSSSTHYQCKNKNFSMCNLYF